MYSEQRSREQQQVNSYPPRPPRQPMQQFYQQQLRQQVFDNGSYSQSSVSKLYGNGRQGPTDNFNDPSDSPSPRTRNIPPSIQLFRQSSTNSVWTTLTESCNSQDDGDASYYQPSPRGPLTNRSRYDTLQKQFSLSSLDRSMQYGRNRQDSFEREPSTYPLEPLSERSPPRTSDRILPRYGERYETLQKQWSLSSLDRKTQYVSNRKDSFETELSIDEKLESLAVDTPPPNVRGIGKLKPPPPAAYCFGGSSRSINSSNSRSTGSGKKSQSLIEIAPGVSVMLRGADETLMAVRDDYLVSEFCICCQELLHCTQDADLVLCPTCKVVSPLEAKTPRSSNYRKSLLDEGDDYQSDLRSVGLGMKHDTVCLYRQELGLK